ncbi:hypothetical protein CUC08_Gglean008006 [Alternaria sp. MG1]|nr:hypothetical protein CUC08_Gglean008006 [Alternaria sp. MG1]
MYLTPRPGQDPKKAKVYNFEAQLAVKGTWEWNQCIQRVGQVVDGIYKANPGMSADQKKLFERFDAAGELVVKARAGDHGKFLVDAAEKSDKLKEIEIKKQNLGTNPVDGQAFETADWAETIEGAYNAGVSNPIVKVGDFISGFYAKPKDGKKSSAREHLAVIKSYKRVQDSAVACGRR